jgi:hypothetical protein
MDAVLFDTTNGIDVSTDMSKHILGEVQKFYNLVFPPAVATCA